MNITETAAGAVRPWWVKAIPYAAVFAIPIGGAMLIYQKGYQAAQDRYTAVIAQNNADNATASTLLVNKARLDEKSKADELSAIDANNLKAKDNEITSRDAVIAGLRSGAIGLRDRFTCPAVGNGPGNQLLPFLAPSTGQRDEASSGGLQAEDAEFFIQESSRADEVVKQLQACQAVVKADRAVMP